MFVITFKTFLIICPLVFLAGFVDSIGGGGGLISLPAYMLAGLPTHMAIATNKLSSAAGTTVTTARFIKNKLIDYKFAFSAVIAAFCGSFCGSKLSLLADEKILKVVLIPVLCVAMFFVLSKKLFGNREEEREINTRTHIIAAIASLLIGFYDGFYGPGTGTFLIIAFNVFAKLDIQKANANAKAVNLVTNITSLVVFIVGGQVLWAVGIAGMACNMAGNFVGSSLALKNAEKITRPIIIVVLILLFIKVIAGF